MQIYQLVNMPWNRFHRYFPLLFQGRWLGHTQLYFQICAQVSLLTKLEGPYIVPGMELGLAVPYSRTTSLTLFPMFSLLFHNLNPSLFIHVGFKGLHRMVLVSVTIELKGPYGAKDPESGFQYAKHELSFFSLAPPQP